MNAKSIVKSIFIHTFRNVSNKKCTEDAVNG